MSDAPKSDPSDDPGTTTALQKMTISEIEDSVISLTPGLSQDRLLSWIMLATVLTQRSKQIKQRIEEAAIAWIKDHGPITCGPMLYTIGKTKTVKCIDVLKCTELLLDACGGDINALTEYLAANPYKHGSCRDILPDEDWKSVFCEEWQDKLALKVTDTRFLPKSRQGSLES